MSDSCDNNHHNRWNGQLFEDSNRDHRIVVRSHCIHTSILIFPWTWYFYLYVVLKKQLSVLWGHRSCLGYSDHRERGGVEQGHLDAVGTSRGCRWKSSIPKTSGPRSYRRPAGNWTDGRTAPVIRETANWDSNPRWRPRQDLGVRRRGAAGPASAGRLQQVRQHAAGQLSQLTEFSI